MTSTFFSLLKLADLTGKSKTSPKTQPPIEKEKVKGPKEMPFPSQESQQVPGLYYNIQIHLPATKDIEVYNAIFKSLKEHLYET